jgi:gas vesicle protein
MSEERPDGRFLLGFFIGGLIGAVIIFLLGTKEGKKAGKLIERKGKETLDDIEERLEEMEEKGKELIEKGEAIKDQVIERIEDKTHDVSKDVTERLDKALEKLEDVQRGSLQTTAKIRKHFVNLPKKK